MSSTPWLQDPDVTLWHGDVLATLRELPAESVDCVVTSPPYWGLRDYGTGEWEGGDAGCDHETARSRAEDTEGWKQSTSAGSRPNTQHICKCGATRIDQQLGLEPTPEQYVERMVEVFREVKRVLAAHGTVWLNLGDSYNGGPPPGNRGQPVDGLNPAHSELGKQDLRKELRRSGIKHKDLVGIPWRVAFALQADGWYLRSDIIWAKPNPMPESVTDRPTKAHEYVFLLSKQPRYFFDQEAVREPATYAGEQLGIVRGQKRRAYANNGTPSGNESPERAYAVDALIHAGRNIRSVWEIATQPYPEAHFATFPEELARRCIAAGCPEQVCRVCGKARERVVETQPDERQPYRTVGTGAKADGAGRNDGSGNLRKVLREDGRGGDLATRKRTDVGFTDCGHSDYRPGIVLDPFMGSGTVAHVARKLGRHAVGIDLSAEYLALAARRLQQQSLFAEAL